MSTRRRRVITWLGFLFGLAACDPATPPPVTADTEPIPIEAAADERAEEPEAPSRASLSDEESEAELEAQALPDDDDVVPYRGTVMLVPLKSFPEDLMVAVEQGLSRELGVQVVRNEVVDLPKFAYYAPRKRYKADKLLEYLDGIAEATNDPDIRVLGLTEVDVSVSTEEFEDWGIFGLGRMPGRVAVISSYRLKRKTKHHNPLHGDGKRDLVRFRVSTVAIHEIGHTFGLDHCGEKESNCVMLDGEGGITNTDMSSGTFGPGCRIKLAGVGAEVEQ